MSDSIKKSPWSKLFTQACNCRENSYSPYSHFKVGAALITSDQQSFTGTNVENASYGGTVCAERVAIFKAVSEGQTQIQQLLIVADTQEPCSPCGLCRQVMAEFMSPQASVILSNLNEEYKVYTIEELLPHSFQKSDLSG